MSLLPMEWHFEMYSFCFYFWRLFSLGKDSGNRHLKALWRYPIVSWLLLFQLRCKSVILLVIWGDVSFLQLHCRFPPSCLVFSNLIMTVLGMIFLGYGYMKVCIWYLQYIDLLGLFLLSFLLLVFSHLVFYLGMPDVIPDTL